MLCVIHVGEWRQRDVDHASAVKNVDVGFGIGLEWIFTRCLSRWHATMTCQSRPNLRRAVASCRPPGRVTSDASAIARQPQRQRRALTGTDRAARLCVQISLVDRLATQDREGNRACQSQRRGDV